MIKPFEFPIYVTRPMLPKIDNVLSKLSDVWDSQWLTNGGPQHALLERRLCEILKTPSVSLFNNGTNALLVAIQGLRLAGEIITTPFTFAATAHAIAWNNIEPVFVDIDEETMNIAPHKITDSITPKTTAILAVHVFGNPCDVYAIDNIGKRYGLRVIYDAAHAFNTEIDGRGIGTFGDVSMFSFHSTKLFHTVEGGCLTTGDLSLKTRFDLLRNFGIKNEDEVILPGINGKMNEVQAAIGLVNLGLLDEERKKRSDIATIYKQRLSTIEGIKHCELPNNVQNSLQYFVVRINACHFGCHRDRLHERLHEYNVFTRKYFNPLCSTYSCYCNLPSASPDLLPVATRIVQETLCLPFYGNMGTDNAEKIMDIIESIHHNPTLSV